MIEVWLWIGLTVAGGVRAWMNVRDALEDKRAHRIAHRNGALLIVARSIVAQESVRAVGYVVAAALGVIALSPLDASKLVVPGLLLFLTLFVVNTFLTAYYRRRLDRANAGRSEG